MKFFLFGGVGFGMRFFDPLLMAQAVVRDMELIGFATDLRLLVLESKGFE